VANNKFFYSVILLFLVLCALYFFQSKTHYYKPLTITTEYGTVTITEPLLIDLINDHYFQRLKGIRQYGPRYYITKKEEYTRYEHSLGVFLLLRRYNAPLNEQIAGLLHDISHTVFSHVGDVLFKSNDAYQDDIQEEFITNTSIAQVLHNYTIEISDILEKNKNFTALECNLPDLCADRLEYNLKGGLIEGLLQQGDITTILNDLVFEDGRWLFTTVDSAKKFAQVPLYLTQNVWGSSDAIITYKWMAEALTRALALTIITFDDIHYSTDDVVWEKLITCNDNELKTIMNKLMHYNNYFKTVDDDNFDTLVKGKFRGVNPLIKIDNQIMRLTELDSNFNNEFYKVKQQMESGWRIKELTSIL